VKALLDTREYEPGQKIADDEMDNLQVKPHGFHGDWNYWAMAIAPMNRSKQVWFSLPSADKQNVRLVKLSRKRKLSVDDFAKY
jgi:hypothetical protein